MEKKIATRIDVNKKLKGVEETLLIPLWARIVETTKKSPIVEDFAAVEFGKMIEYDFSTISTDNATLVGVSIRTKLIDSALEDFLDLNPEALIINLGCGLCTRYFRINNKKLIWIDFDLPNVIQIKETIIESIRKKNVENELIENTLSLHNYILVSGSLLEKNWLEHMLKTSTQKFMELGIENINERPVFIIAEGVLMYFNKSQVKSIMKDLLKHWSKADFIFEACSPILTLISGFFTAVKSTGSKFHWGVFRLKSLEKWDKRIKLIKQYTYYGLYKERWGKYKILNYIPGLRSFLKLAYIRFE